MIPTIPHDKALHACYGAGQSLIGALSAHVAGQPLWAGALLVPLMFAVGKEAHDRITRRGTPEFLDIVATVAGALPAVIAGAL